MNFNIGNFGVSTTSATPFNFGNSLASAGRYWGHVCNEYRGLESKNVPMFLEFGGRNGACLIGINLKINSNIFQVLTALKDVAFGKP